MTVKHISFDVWNTLITANPLYAEERNKVIAEYTSCSEAEAATVYKEVKTLLDLKAEKGICGTSRNAWETLSTRLNIDLDKVDGLKRDCLAMFIKHPPILNPELCKKLEELSSTYSLSVKSNTNFVPGSFLAVYSGLTKLPFDFMHFSDEFCLCKPDPRFFKLSFDEMVTFDLAPEEILHVGDSLIYDGKAVDIGMKFCHITNPEDLLAKLKKEELINA